MAHAPRQSFELTIEAEFCAAHAIVLGGQREPVHGHNWRVTACVTGPRLDREGLLCDFHAVEAALREILAPFHNGNLNETPPFDEQNPTAEAVAAHIALSLDGAIPPSDRERGVRVVWARVTEAPGCAAICRLSHD